MKPTSIEEICRRRRFRSQLFRWLCVVGMLILMIWGITPWYQFKWNVSASLDGCLYLVAMHAPVHRGDIVLFRTPENALHKKHDFGKYAIAMAGDAIVVKQRDFYLGDTFLGHAKTHSLTGVPLNAAMTDGVHVIPDGKYFVWTPHKDSYDSRYEDIGLIDDSAIIGRLSRIF